jgi:hypothetical protein
MPATAASQVFTSIRTVGGILPADMLRAIMAGGREVSASKPSDYHVAGSRTSVKDSAERHWSYLRGLWRQVRADIGDGGDPTGLASENWLLPLFEEHGYGRLERVGAPGIPSDDGTATFEVTHQWRHLLVHLVPWSLDLERRPVGGGLPPQSMVQDCLNRSTPHLWAVVSNGKVLRFLRDSSALTGSAYVEVDLEAMFDGELFDEFVLLYRLLHVSRFELPDDASVPSACRMEKWRTEAIDSGTRFLNDISDGVRAAVIALGTGFLKHPANDRLRQEFDADVYKRALLRLVYRLLFWFVAEERDLLHDDEVPESAKQRYLRYFSARRLRDASVRRAGGSHGDRWETLQFVFRGFAADNGLPELGLPGLGGIYDQTGTDTTLDGLSLSNEYLLKAVKSLARVEDKSTRRFRNVDYEHLDSEELGAIYQSLLELIPNRTSTHEFTFGTALGNPRKGTGSYYTPTSLVDCLLDSSLDPVLTDAEKKAETEATAAGKDLAEVREAIAEALLSVTVCDPACGSGHFLVAAARRIAKRVASVRESNPEPSEEGVRHALREAVSRCVYGVDLNPMAVELAKVSLWLEALEPGKALNFLDSKIKHGNGLIGATPALIAEGIPDSAFKPIEGDDPKWARSLLRANVKTDPDALTLFSDETIYTQGNTELANGLARIAHAPDGKLPQVHAQAAAYEEWRTSEDNEFKRLVADAWCAAFVWIKIEPRPGNRGVPAIVNRVFTDLQKKGKAGIPPETYAEIERLRDELGFFHWHLEFPDIFHVADGETEWVAGFTCVLANPPWDKVDFEDKKYFSTVDDEIANMAGQARRDRIEEWKQENPEAGERYEAARRNVKATFGFAGSSGAYEQCAKGLTAPGVNSLQTDQLFTELFATITAPNGRVGCIIQSAIATGAGGQYLFGSITERGGVASLYDFENRRGIFPDIDSRMKFCLLTLVGKDVPERAARFAFFLLDTAELDDADRVFALAPEEIALINPNSKTLPIFRNRRAAALTAGIYQRIPVLWDETKDNGNRWNIRFKNLFNMTDDSDLFRTRDKLEKDGWKLVGNVFARGEERMLPLYEAKIAHHFDHRFNSFDGTGNDDRHRISAAEKRDPTATAIPRYWIQEDGKIPVERNGNESKIPGAALRLAELEWDRGWLCGWRDVCRSTDERTAIAAFIPRTAAGHTLPLMLPYVPAPLAVALVAAQSSLVFDFVSRQKIGGIHMNLFAWKQQPVPTPEMMEPHLQFIVPRVLELVYTAYDMKPLARDLGDNGEPFQWDEDRRALLRAELDAFFFQMYGIDSHDDVDYILETFATETGGLKHNEIKEHGEYRTKRLVLEYYDRMSAAAAVGREYETDIAPAPGDGPRHPARA